MIETAFYQALKQATNGPVYSGVRGDHLPAVVYNLAGLSLPISVSAKAQISTSRFQVDCYADNTQAVKALAKQIIQSLHNTTQLGTIPVQRVLVEDSRDQSEQSSGVFRQIIQIKVFHH